MWLSTVFRGHLWTIAECNQLKKEKLLNVYERQESSMNRFLVEAGGIEPPSEKDSREESTGLGWVSYLASGLAPNQGVLRPVHRKVSRVARQTQRHASPIVLHLASLSGVSRFGVPLN